MIDELAEVHRRAFVHDASVPGLVRELFAGGYTVLSFTADVDDRIVGHVMCSWSTIEGSDVRLLQLAPLGVLPEFQGQGHGSALVRRTLDAARAIGEPAVLLEGNPKYYGRFGFVRADELGLLPPPETVAERGAEGFQVAVFDRERLPKGQVVYAPPFTR